MHITADDKTHWRTDIPGAPACWLSTLFLGVTNALDWNRDMAPWDDSAAFMNREPFTGGADDYLRLLMDKIMSETEKRLSGSPLHSGN